MKWISIKDRLPDNEDEEYLCVSAKFGGRDDYWEYSYIIILGYENGKWLDDDNREHNNNADYHWITHWMPLPEYPKKEDFNIN